MAFDFHFDLTAARHSVSGTLAPNAQGLLHTEANAAANVWTAPIQHIPEGVASAQLTFRADAFGGFPQFDAEYPVVVFRSTDGVHVQTLYSLSYLRTLAESALSRSGALAELDDPDLALQNLGVSPGGAAQTDVNYVAASGAALELPASFAMHDVTMDQNCAFTFAAPARRGHRFSLLLQGAFAPLFPQASWDGGLQPQHFNPSRYRFESFDGGATYQGERAWASTPTPPPAPPATGGTPFGFTAKAGAPSTSATVDLTGAVEGEFVLIQIAAETSNAITVTPPGQAVAPLPGNGNYAWATSTPAPVAADEMDDPAIWVHPTSPSQSVVIGCRKSNSGGGLYVYNLDGTVHQFLAVGKMNNVDIRTHAGTGRIILTASNRTTNSLDYFELNPATRTLSAVGSTSLGFEPYGCCMGDLSGSLFGYVTQNAATSGAFRRYALTVPSSGNVTGSLSGSTTTATLTEGMAVHDAGGYLFLGEEDAGLYRYNAADITAARTTIDTVGAGNLVADVEGVEVVLGRDGDPGYILVSSQGDSTFQVYDLASPHAHRKEFTVTDVNDCDGVTATRKALGTAFPDGLVVVHDSTTGLPGANFKFVDAGLVFGRYTASSEVVNVIPPTRSAGGPALNLSLWRYWVPASPPASLTFTLSESVEGAVTWGRWAVGSIDPSTPIAQTALALFPSSTDTITVPSVTTDVPGAVIVAGAAVGVGAAGEASIPVSAGWTTQVTSTDLTTVIATKGQQAAAGPTGTVVFGPLSTPRLWAAWQLALRPAGVPGDGGGTGTNPSTATAAVEFDTSWAGSFPTSPDGLWKIQGPVSGRNQNIMDPSRATVSGGALSLTSNANVREGAELQSVFAALQPGPGKYEARLKTTPTAGIVNSFYWVSNNFGPRRISIHFLTRNPTQAVFEILWNGATYQHVHDLGFNASSAQHVYAFQWESGSKVTFSVDDVDVHTFNATASINLTSPDRGLILANTWTGTDPAWSGGLPGSSGTMVVEHIRYFASQTAPPPAPPSGTIGVKPTGFPSTTGIHYGVPTAAEAGLTTIAARQFTEETIEDKIITGAITVNPGSGKVCTMRRVRILGNSTTNEGYAVRVLSGRLVIEDFEIRGTGGQMCAHNGLAGTVTARRGVITDFGRDGIKAASDSTYEDLYIKRVASLSVSGAHEDGIQFTSALGNIIVRRCVMDMQSSATSAFLLKYDIGSAAYAPGPVLIEDNYLGGGGITSYTVRGNGGGGNAEWRNVTVRNNIYHGDSQYNIDLRKDDMTGLVIEGNTRSGGGAIIIG